MGSISEMFPASRLRGHHGYTSSADSSSTSGEWGSLARSAQSSPGFPVTLKASLTLTACFRHAGCTVTLKAGQASLDCLLSGHAGCRILRTRLPEAM